MPAKRSIYDWDNDNNKDDYYPSPMTTPPLLFQQPQQQPRASFVQPAKRIKVTWRRNQATGAESINKSFMEHKNKQYEIAIAKVNDHFLTLTKEAIKEAEKVLLSSPSSKKMITVSALASEHYRMQRTIRELYRRDAGSVVAMGQDDVCQLGINNQKYENGNNNNKNDDDSTAEKEPVYAPTIVRTLDNNFVQVAAGGMHSVALREDGKVYSWGCPDDMALGRLPTNIDAGYTDAEISLPKQITSDFIRYSNTSTSTDTGVVMIDAGDSHTMMLSLEGNVYMAGMYKDMDSGKFADLRHSKDTTLDFWKEPEVDEGEEPPKRPPQIRLPRSTPCHVHQIQKRVKFIACGVSFNAAILEDNTLLTWGMGHNGELARSADMTTPNKEGEFDLGQNYVKNMETGKYKLDIVAEKFLTPGPPRWADKKGANRIVTYVACGGYHILVAAKDTPSGISKLYTSGLNNYGQLGHGDHKNRHELTLVDSLKDENIWRLAAGEHHSLAMNLLGTELHAFGRSDYGQLGLYKKDVHGAGSFETTPKLVTFPKSDTLNRLIDLQTGDRNSMVISSISDNHQCYSWGFGETGTTGHTSVKNINKDGEKEYEDKDITRPKKIKFDFPDSYCNKVYNMSGGGQHTLLIAKRFSSS